MPQPIPVIVLAGQSNANGLAITGAAMQAANAGGALLLHLAANGSALAASLSPGSGTWQAPSDGDPGGRNFRLLEAQVQAILDPASPSFLPGAFLSAVIWVQGEADSVGPAVAAAYGENLAAFRAALAAAFGDFDLVVSQLSAYPAQRADFAPPRAESWLRVRAEQAALAAGRDDVAILDPDRLGTPAREMFRDDAIHYAPDFAATLGRTLAGVATQDLAAPSIRSRIGTDGADRFTPAADGVLQILGGGGTDTIDLAQASRDLTLTDAPGGGRVTAPGALIAWLQVERVLLGQGDDSARLAGSLRWLAGGGGDDSLRGGDAGERLWGGEGRDLITGARGNDRIAGGDGDDRLEGWRGNDRIAGGAGQDRLAGAEGRDTLSGGAGADWLSGGPGRDTFVFAAGDGRDTVTDFAPGQDRLMVTGTASVTRAGDDIVVTTGDGSVRLLDAAPAWDTGRDLIFD